MVFPASVRSEVLESVKIFALKKLFCRFLLLLVLAALAVLFWPGHYYVRQALVHQLPKIDQYPIFENRVVKAGDPAPLPFAGGV